MPHQQLRSRHYRRAIGSHAVQKQNHRRLAALVYPPTCNRVTGAGNRHYLSRKADRQWNRVIGRFDQLRTQPPGRPGNDKSNNQEPEYDALTYRTPLHQIIDPSLGYWFQILRISARQLPFRICQVFRMIPTKPRTIEMSDHMAKVHRKLRITVLWIRLHLLNKLAEMLVRVFQVIHQLCPTHRMLAKIDHLPSLHYSFPHRPSPILPTPQSPAPMSVLLIGAGAPPSTAGL